MTAEFFATTFLSRLRVRCGRPACGDVPWQQLLDASDGVVGDAGQHLAQIGFRVHIRLA